MDVVHGLGVEHLLVYLSPSSQLSQFFSYCLPVMIYTEKPNPRFNYCWWWTGIKESVMLCLKNETNVPRFLLKNGKWSKDYLDVSHSTNITTNNVSSSETELTPPAEPTANCSLSDVPHWSQKTNFIVKERHFSSSLPKILLLSSDLLPYLCNLLWWNLSYNHLRFRTGY